MHLLRRAKNSKLEVSKISSETSTNKAEGKYDVDIESGQILKDITSSTGIDSSAVDPAHSESDGFEEDSFIYADLKKSESPSVDESILKELETMKNTTDPREARRRVVLSPRTSDNSNDSGR